MQVKSIILAIGFSFVAACAITAEVTPNAPVQQVASADDFAKAIIKAEEATPVKKIEVVQVRAKKEADDCQGIAIDAASAYGLAKQRVESLPLASATIGKAKWDAITHEIEWFDAKAKKSAVEYLSHPECTADLDDVKNC